jgi:hypothetical protein
MPPQPATAQRVFRVTDPPFGARGDGRTDDTAAVQRAVDAARRAGGGTVLFPRGTYVVVSVFVAPGMTLQGEPGAVLRRPPRPPRASGAAEARIVVDRKWMRMLSTAREPWDAEADSPLLVIRGLTLDGSRGSQGAFAGFELEQAHLLFLTAATRRRGRLRAVVEDCAFLNSPADGVSIYTNCSVRVTGCTATDCFRGAVVVTGGHTQVTVQRLRTVSTGPLPTGIDVEVDSAGYGGSLRVEITAEDLDLDGDFDLGLNGGSFTGARITSRRPPFRVAARGSTVDIRDSSFAVGALSDQENRVVWPHRVTFTRCAFHVTEAAERGEANRSLAALHVYWNITGSSESGQRLRLVDCSFSVAPDVEPGDTVYALYAEPDRPGRDNLVAVQGGNLGSGFDRRFQVLPGGLLQVDGAPAGPQSGLAPGAEATGRSRALHVQRVEPGGPQTVRAVVVDEARLGDAAGLARFTGLDGWLILGEAPPVGRAVPGRAGDVFRLKGHVPGAVREWACAVPHPAAATWRPIHTALA